MADIFVLVALLSSRIKSLALKVKSLALALHVVALTPSLAAATDHLVATSLVVAVSLRGRLIPEGLPLSDPQGKAGPQMSHQLNPILFN